MAEIKHEPSCVTRHIVCFLHVLAHLQRIFQLRKSVVMLEFGYVTNCLKISFALFSDLFDLLFYDLKLERRHFDLIVCLLPATERIRFDWLP